MKLKIEILCQPCIKCENLLKRTQTAISMAQVHADAELSHITDLKLFGKYSVSISQTPVMIINGNVEFAGGNLPLVEQICKRLKDIKFGGDFI